jgi:hypothetical protein
MRTASRSGCGNAFVRIAAQPPPAKLETYVKIRGEWRYLYRGISRRASALLGRDRSPAERIARALLRTQID